MNKYKIKENYKIDYDRLIKYGFNDKLEYREYIMNNEFEVVVRIEDNSFLIDVYDEFDEKYLPFYISNFEGEILLEVNKNVVNIIDVIYLNCFVENTLKNDVINYVSNKYSAKLERPFKKHFDYITIKNYKNKWFGIIVNIEYVKLGLDKVGKCDIINLKNDDVDNIIDNEYIFKAYHMNKKYWISIILTNNNDLEKVKKLIDKSYELIKD